MVTSARCMEGPVLSYTPLPSPDVSGTGSASIYLLPSSHMQVRLGHSGLGHKARKQIEAEARLGLPRQNRRLTRGIQLSKYRV